MSYCFKCEICRLNPVGLTLFRTFGCKEYLQEQLKLKEFTGVHCTLMLGVGLTNQILPSQELVPGEIYAYLNDVYKILKETQHRLLKETQHRLLDWADNSICHYLYLGWFVFRYTYVSFQIYGLGFALLKQMGSHFD